MDAQRHDPNSANERCPQIRMTRLVIAGAAATAAFALLTAVSRGVADAAVASQQAAALSGGFADDPSDPGWNPPVDPGSSFPTNPGWSSQSDPGWNASPGWDFQPSP